MKPVIGISINCRFKPEEGGRGKLTLPWNYPEAIMQAGGVPILIPPLSDMEAIAKIIDGWLIPGGDDFDSSLWGEPLHPAAKPDDPKRYEGEAKLYQSIDNELPVLGICYGCQFLNVVRGGSLHQHLPDILGHDRDKQGLVQDYRIAQDSKLYKILESEQASGMSTHHQGVNRPGENMAIVAHNEDNQVEAIEATDRPWLIGVQWHPEQSLDNPTTKTLFTKFVAAASQYAKEKIHA